MWLILVVVIGLVLWAYSSSKKSDREREEARKKREREDFIRRSYPNAYKQYWGKQVPSSELYRTYTSMYVRRADGSCNDSEWRIWEENIIKQQEATKRKEEDKKWEANQKGFANSVRNLCKEVMPAYGNYNYTISLTTQNGSQLNLLVWQHFTFAACLEKDLDYTYNQAVKNNTNNIPYQQKNGILENKNHFTPINDFIRSLSAGRNVLVFFNDEIPGWSNGALTNTYLHISADLPDNIREINVAIDRSLGDESKNGRELLSLESPDIIVFIDAITTNDELKKNCEFIFKTFQEKRPLLAYISIVKCHDRKEMELLIESSKQDALKREAEEKAREEERKRQEVERAKLSAHAPAVFAENVKSWEHLYGNFYYNYLFYYYPTNIPNFEATQEEWWNRRNVWDFKNDPDKNILPEDHETTLKEIIPQIKHKLSETFGEDYLQFLTLACLPASTKLKNIARYEEFSNRLCTETGMINGYPYITIVKDGLPRHETGQSAPPEVTIADWFNGKYVLLFDDVITRGRTMLRYKEIFEQKGAIVVGGFTLGKTKHERPTQGGISYSSKQLFPPQPTTSSDNDFELPF